MIEQIVLTYLSTALSVPVFAEVPTAPGKSFVVIEKTGSGNTNHISSAMIAVQSYADTLLGAAQLNEAVKEAMENLTDLDSIGRCKLNTDYNFTDTASKRYRYQAVFDITHY